MMACDLSRRNAALIAGDHQHKCWDNQMKATGSPYGSSRSDYILGRATEHTAGNENEPELDNLFRQLTDCLTRVEIAGD